ncbi:AAA family ATPase [Tissierella sp. MSJ-40]|uniref:AAA family ATPase n=1 Tax=Tissierella simiarum TaxID=2841534 RepID=A0ABS6E3I7_9FIRM|nr:AAA family ATPase [Tissierella simiarum]MBU5437475.1 AAA family ATPase [Tissierella simiarum]
MRLIDNRYKVDKVIEDGLNNAIYQVTDFWDNDKKQFMKLYNYEKRKEVINYFINNFIYLSKIRHEYLLASDQFSLVKTIDRKKVNVLQYYSTVEYVNSPSLSQFTKELTFKERLNIVLDVIKIIDFLHYRGIVYRHLSPSNLFLLEDGTIKLKDLATIFEKIINTDYDDLTRYFLAPEVLLNQEEIDKRADYYSIGMLMKYLFLEDFLVDKVDAFIYYSEDELSPDQEVFLNEIIKNLTKKNSLARDVNLGQLMEDINLKFHMEYPYNLMEERNNLYFKTKIVGRQKEIERILELDKELVAGTLIHRGIIINGSSGMGKTRFLKEISHQLKIRGRDVYLTEIDENDGIDLMAMANILRQSMKDTPQELMEKYGKELAKILPDLRFTIGEPTNTDLSQYKEKLRLFDRITNYFEELSKDKIIYIAIDDLQNCNSNFLMLLNYLINNIKSKQVFFILSFKDESSVKNTIIKEKIVEWKLNKNVLEVSLLKLNLEEIGEMIQYILGISYRPIKFASVLLKESQGNPRYIEYSMKDLHNRKELYLNKNGMWDIKTDNYSNIYFPTDINEALKKQLNLIKTDYFEIFKVMSIFNSSLSKKTLVRMLNISPKKLEEDLERLITLRLIDERVADWGYSYSIYNSQLKKLIYHEISEEEKSRLHKSAAKVIEDTYGEQLKFVMEELIYHLLNSNQPMKALEIILKEVKKIDNQYSSNSVFLWEKAYGIINDNSDEVKLQVLDNLVNIYSLRGDVEKTNKYLKELTIEAEKLSNLYYIIRSRTLRADYYYKKNQIDLAQRETRDIERISKEHNFVEGMISALIIKSRIGLNIKTLDYVTEKLNEALELSKVSGVHAYLGTIYNIWGITCYLKGNMGESIEKYEKSITFFQNNGNYLESTKPMNNIGNIYAQHYGDREKAMEFYKKGLDIATQYGFLESEIVFLNNMGEIYIRHREYGKAMEYIEAARKGALEVEDVNLVFLTNINLGLVNLLIG